MANEPAKIGVLGGMGPEATVLFMHRVVAATPASDDRDHIPLLVDNNPQVPSRIAALIEGAGDDPGPVLARMAAGLEAGGAAALVMPCNTAHNYTSQIRAAVSVPFLSMVEMTGERLAANFADGCRVGVLGSPALQITGVFDREFTARGGIKALYPADREAMLGAIRAFKVSAHDEKAAKTVCEAGRELKAAGADILLIACTEFSLVADQVGQVHRMLDSLDVLVEETIGFSRRAAGRSLQDAPGKVASA